MILDDRLPYPLSSHHQKTLIIAANSSGDEEDQPVAYIGGVDFITGRWDTKYHNETAIRDTVYNSGGHKGWIDGHLRIHRPAAKDVASNCVARWNSDYLPCQGLTDELVDFENPSYDHVSPLDYSSSKTSAKLGNQASKSCELSVVSTSTTNSLLTARTRSLVHISRPSSYPSYRMRCWKLYQGSSD
ncbi:Phospholipase D alpha 1 [Phytophthora citrophthora]|uniref:Phospholipase D alpha 1 n=1 Tax=Phytophthora citrophthora TaxID=4793 RepID=A0AAD9GBC2_9STRA|nr:Phospholipase D alpha 1 [Phytophthora citrophthora]